MPGGQLVKADMPQGRVGAILKLMDTGHCSYPKVRFGVLLEPLTGKAFKLDRAIGTLASAFFLKEHSLPLETRIR